MQNTIHEECGVFGIFANETQDVAHTVYYGLFSLQHRGQEGCGICVNDDGVFHSYKELGLVHEAFTPEILASLGTGNIAVGHVRYSTTGDNSRENCQPIEVHHRKGTMAVAHNGNLVNAYELRQELELNGSIFHSTSDTEIIAYEITRARLQSSSIEEAVSKAMYRIKGAYSLVIMSPQKLIAVRDPNGLRPLCYGIRKDGSYIVASESCALHAIGAAFIRDILPGEIVVFNKEGVSSISVHCNTQTPSLCVFEYIYFARSDSSIDGCSVQEARILAGRFLAKEYPVSADVVIGVPDSGLDAALGYSRESGIPYGIGFAKNKYIGRTFISPVQTDREDKVRIKLNVIENAVKGKRVILIDDSIVRGTTSARIVTQLREAGALAVHVRISAPPFLNPCYYGTDIDSKDSLIACKYTPDEICRMIGADSLGYLSLQHARELAGEKNKARLCDACFSGHYPTEVPTGNVKSKFEKKISEQLS